MEEFPERAERDRRLARLSRYAACLLSAYGTLLSQAPVNDSPAAAEVELAQLRAATSILMTHVEGLLALIREVRLDAFLLGASEGCEALGASEGCEALASHVHVVGGASEQAMDER